MEPAETGASREKRGSQGPSSPPSKRKKARSTGHRGAGHSGDQSAGGRADLPPDQTASTTPDDLDPATIHAAITQAATAVTGMTELARALRSAHTPSAAATAGSADVDATPRAGTDPGLEAAAIARAQETVLVQYAAVDPNFDALFSAWADRRVHHQGEDEFVAHDAVGAILEVGRRVPTMLPQMEALAQRAMTEESRSIYRCLGAKPHRQIKAALRLLTAIVSTSPSVALHVLREFDFGFKPLRRMASLDGGGKDRFSVRSYFATLVVGFLSHHGHPEHPRVVEKLLAIKGFTSSLFAEQGCFVHDKAPMLGRLLEALRLGVSEAQGVSRRTKLLLFTSKTLERLGSLYGNEAEVPFGAPSKGPSDGHPTSTEPETTRTVRALTHGLLLSVCGSAETGIVFLPRKSQHGSTPNGGVDAAGEGSAWGSVTGNPVLQRFLHTLTPQLEDPLVRELSLSVLQCCPDTVAGYVRDAKLISDPKLSTAWLERAAFFGAILDLGVSAAAVTPIAAGAVTGLALPLEAQGGAIPAGLQHKCRLVQFTSLKLLTKALLRVQRVVGVLPEPRRAALLQAARKRLPGIEVLLSTRHKCFSPRADHTGEDDAAEGGLAQTAIMQALVLYTELFPSAFATSKVDIGKLIPPPERLLTLPEPVVTEVARLLRLHAAEYRWEAPRKGGGDVTPLQALLRLVCTAVDPVCRTAVQAAAVAVVAAVDVFGDSPHEPEVWVDAVAACPAAAPLLEEVLLALVKDPYTHQHELAEACPEPPGVSPITLMLCRVASPEVPPDAAATTASGTEGPGSDVIRAVFLRGAVARLLHTLQHPDPFARLVLRASTDPVLTAYVRQFGGDGDLDPSGPGEAGLAATVRLSKAMDLGGLDRCAAASRLATADVWSKSTLKAAAAAVVEVPALAESLGHAMLPLWDPTSRPHSLAVNAPASLFNLEHPSAAATAAAMPLHQLLRHVGLTQHKDPTRVEGAALLQVARRPREAAGSARHVAQIIARLVREGEALRDRATCPEAALCDRLHTCFGLLVHLGSGGAEGESDAGETAVHKAAVYGTVLEDPDVTAAVSDPATLPPKLRRTLVLWCARLAAGLARVRSDAESDAERDARDADARPGPESGFLAAAVRLAAASVAALAKGDADPNQHTHFDALATVHAWCGTGEVQRVLTALLALPPAALVASSGRDGGRAASDTPTPTPTPAGRLVVQLLGTPRYHPLAPPLQRWVLEQALHSPESPAVFAAPLAELGRAPGGVAADVFAEHLPAILTAPSPHFATLVAQTLGRSPVHVAVLERCLVASGSLGGLNMRVVLAYVAAVAPAPPAGGVLTAGGGLTRGGLTGGGLTGGGLAGFDPATPLTEGCCQWLLAEVAAAAAARDDPRWVVADEAALRCIPLLCRTPHDPADALALGAALATELHRAVTSSRGRADPDAAPPALAAPLPEATAAVAVAMLTPLAGRDHSPSPTQLELAGGIAAGLSEAIVFLEGGDEADGSTPVTAALAAAYRGLGEVAAAAVAVASRCGTDVAPCVRGDGFSRHAARVQQLVATFRLCDPVAMGAVAAAVELMLAVGGIPQRVFVADVLGSPQFESAVDNAISPLPIDPSPHHHGARGARNVAGAGAAAARAEAATSLDELEHRRVGLCGLLDRIVAAQPTACSAEHVAVLLNGYTASVAPSDRALLRLMQAHEASGAELGGAALDWGGGSVDRRENREVQVAGLSSTHVTAVIGSIDPDRVLWSTEHFTRLATAVGPSAGGQKLSLQEQLAGYDPSFLVPVLATALRDPAVAGPDLRLLIETGLFGYIALSLSLEDDTLRRIGYRCMSLYRKRLEGARFKERLQVVVAIDALRNAIPPDTVAPRVSPLICGFVAKAVRLALHPDDLPMYTLVNKFLLSRPAIDLDDVPMFYALFNSSSATYRAERLWMLRLLCWGCQAESDYRILRKRRVLDLVLHMYDSSAADGKAREAAMDLVCRCCADPDVARDLVRNHGLLAWLRSQPHRWDPAAELQGSSVDDVLRLTELCVCGLASTPSPATVGETPPSTSTSRGGGHKNSSGGGGGAGTGSRGGAGAKADAGSAPAASPGAVGLTRALIGHSAKWWDGRRGRVRVNGARRLLSLLRIAAAAHRPSASIMGVTEFTALVHGYTACFGDQEEIRRAAAGLPDEAHRRVADAALGALAVRVDLVGACRAGLDAATPAVASAVSFALGSAVAACTRFGPPRSAEHTPKDGAPPAVGGDGDGTGSDPWGRLVATLAWLADASVAEPRVAAAVAADKPGCDALRAAGDLAMEVRGSRGVEAREKWLSVAERVGGCLHEGTPLHTAVLTLHGGDLAGLTAAPDTSAMEVDGRASASAERGLGAAMALQLAWQGHPPAVAEAAASLWRDCLRGEERGARAAPPAHPKETVAKKKSAKRRRKDKH